MALTDNQRGMVLMNIAMLAFTLNDTCMKAVSTSLPLFQVIFLRGTLTTLVLLGVAMATGGLHFWPGGRDGRVIGLRTVAEVLATVTFLVALTHMPLANLSAIMQSLPLAVTLTAMLVFKDPVGWRRLVAIAVGFVGVLLIIRPGTEGFDEWSMLGLASVGFVVVRDLSTRELSKALPSVTVAIWASVAVTVMGAIGLLVQGWQPVSLHEGALILGATLNLVIGYMTVVMVMRVGDIGFVAPFRYMALLWAIILGWLTFGTLPDGLTLIGAAIVVATGIFTLWRERQKAR